MLKQLMNECRLAITIEPQGAVLIKAGESSTGGVDMAFVRTMRNGIPQVYLPGSSLKGVMRSHAEAVLRSVNENSVCNLFKDTKHKNANLPGHVGCSYRVGSGNSKNAKPAPQRYKESCPACKLFGSLAYGGRFNIWDAYSPEDGDVGSEFRDGVGIDRFTGGAFGKAKYQFEVITSGAFHTEVTLKNFEMWQLAWVLLVLRDMADGLVPIGMGTSRGLGNIKLTINGITLDYFRLDPVTQLEGIAGVEVDLKDYGVEDDWPPLPLDASWTQTDLLTRQRIQIAPAHMSPLITYIQQHFPGFLKSLRPVPNGRAS